jgi:hypothetical protein
MENRSHLLSCLNAHLHDQDDRCRRCYHHHHHNSCWWVIIIACIHRLACIDHRYHLVS